MPIYIVRSIQGGKTVQRKQVAQGLGRDPAVIHAQPDVIYVLADTLYNKGPAEIAAKRVGKNLLIALDGGSPDVPDIIIEGYFDFPPAPIEGALGGSQHQTYDLGHLTAPSADLAAGAGAPALPVAVSEPVQASLEGSGWVEKLLWAGAGLGALALAGGGGLGGGDDTDISAVALEAIKGYADDGAKDAPKLSLYTDAGVTGVTAGNLVAINSAVDALASSDVDSLAKLQNVVDAYNRILGEAGDATGASTAAKATANNFLTIGADIGQAQSNANVLGLLNSVIANLTRAHIDSVSEIDALAVVVEKVMATAAGQDIGALGIDDFASLGMVTSGSGAVTAANLGAVRQAIAGAGGQAMVDTYAELNALVTAVATIYNYAEDASQAVPTSAQYAAMGVTGVSDGNVAAINSAVAGKSGAGVDDKAKLQVIVDAYAAILAEANGSSIDATPGVNPTAEQYASVGADIGQAAVDARNLALLNDVVANLSASKIDSLQEIDALAGVVDAIMAGVGGHPDLTVSELALLGIATSGAGAVNGGNVAAINAALGGVASSAEIDSFTELNGLITAVATIHNYAEDDTQAVPTLAHYAAAGITGVTSTNLDAINSAVKANTGADVADKAALQAIVDAYNAILAEANGATADATPDDDPTAARFALIGADIGAAANHATNLNLLNDAIAKLNATAIDSIGEIDNLATAANAVISGAGGATGPTLAQLSLLGITGVSVNNQAAVQNAIAATVDNGLEVDTMVELQSVVTAAVNAAATSQTKIQGYAGDETNTSPAVADYANIGVDGVAADNLAAINSAVSALTGSDVGTPYQVQSVVDAYNRILSVADGVPGGIDAGNAPTAQDFASIGASAGLSTGGVIGGADLASAALKLLDEAVAGKSRTDIDRIAEIDAIATAVDHVMNLASLETGAATTSSQLTMAELSLLGVDSHLADEAQEIDAILRAIADSADSGSGVDTLLALQNIVNTHAV